MPRNKAKFEAAQALRAVLRDILEMLACPCCRRPRITSAKELMPYLPPGFQRHERTVRQHVQAILEELEAEADQE
jgi:hypothetical protein